MPKTVLESVRDDLLSWNVVHTEREFCEDWLCMSECYMRTLRHRKLAPSTTALATLSSKLCYYADRMSSSNEQRHHHYASEFRRLQQLCDRAITAASLAKWQEAVADHPNRV